MTETPYEYLLSQVGTGAAAGPTSSGNGPLIVT